MYLLFHVTGLCSVGELYTLHGELPPQLSGAWFNSRAASFVRQSGKTWRSLIFVWWVFGSIALLSLHVRESSL